MGQWISSKEFAKLHNISVRALQLRIKRLGMQKILNLNTYFFMYSYTKGIGRGGKVLQIWSEPFKSEAEAEAFIHNYRVDRLERAIQQNKADSLGSLDFVFSQHDKITKSLLTPQHNKAVRHDRIESSNIHTKQNKVSSNNIPSKAIESNRASIDIAMGGVVDSHNSLCGDLHVCDDGGDDACNLLHNQKETDNIRDISHTLNMTDKNNMISKGDITNTLNTTDKSSMTDKQETNLQNVGQKTQDIKEIQNIKQDNLTPFDFATTKARRIALEKRRIVKEWEALKAKGVSAKDFVAYVNANRESNYNINKAWLNKAGQRSITQRNTEQTKVTQTRATQAIKNTAEHDYTLKLSLNKLYSWQRAYKESGLDGLLDTRGHAREGINKIKDLGLEDVLDKIISAQSGRINIHSIHELLHLYLHAEDIHDIIDFKSKKSEYISYAVLHRYIQSWKKKNPLKVALIYKGEDALIGNMKASLGKSNYKVTSINQVVEIDSTPLDKVFNAESLAESLGVDISHIKSWQKRYVLISLVDTYSRVVSFHISDTENSLGIARAIAKYILKYGKPQMIKGDNGKAFLSKYTKEIMQNLDIEYKNVRAYSGWLKPYVENTFRALQDRIIAWGKGYIGHNVSQRQAIEFFFSKKERRLKKGALTNLKELDSFESMLHAIDLYTDSMINNRYIDALGSTPIEAYNQKADEAIAMNEYELVMKLSPSVKRRVNKKGIMHGGVWYQSIQAFNYNSVIIRANINNTQELFVYDENGKFIEIATAIGFNGVSAESAKRAEKITLKRIKEAKKEMDVARREQYELLEPMLSKASKHAPKAIKPCVPVINNTDIISAKLKSEARAVSGSDIANLRELQIQEEKERASESKKDLSFFAAVIKKREE